MVTESLFVLLKNELWPFEAFTLGGNLLIVS